jgi:hypothetical protein
MLSTEPAMKLLFAVWALCGCRADAGYLADAGQRADSSRIGFEPQSHRAASVICDGARHAGSVAVGGCGRPGNTDGLPVPVCVKDSDCTSGANGRCLGGQQLCETYCSYDACFADSDCASSEVCSCRQSGPSSANLCVPAGDCRIDADCGAGGFCSPSSLYGFACGEACGHGYFCRTRRDACLDNSDCGQGTACLYDRREMRWKCSWFTLPY